MNPHKGSNIQNISCLSYQRKRLVCIEGDFHS